MFEGKRILITGATGLIGSSLVRRLLRCRGARVVACGRDAGRLSRVFSGELALGLEILEHDIGRPIPASSGEFDYVFHAASPIAGAVIRTEPVSVVASNIRGAENCLEYLRLQLGNHGRKGTMVVFSSATVYGEAFGAERVVDEREDRLGETLGSVTAPYSESKRMVEVLATAYARQYGIGVRIARLAYVYGPCTIRPQTAFYEFIGKAAAGQDMTFNGSGFPRRDNIFVDDAVEGLVRICERGEDAVPYNVSSNGELGNYAAIDELAAAIGRAAAAEGIVSNVVLGGSDARKPGIRLDNSRLKALGWQLGTSLEEGVRKVFSNRGL